MSLLIAIMLLGAAQTPAASPVASDPAIARVVALYDELCLRAFPDDTAVDAAMTAKGATALTREQIAVTLRDDPGRGWLLKDGDRNIQITLELPPFHACSVRRTVSGGETMGDAYRAVVASFQAANPGFGAGPPMDADMGDLHIHATGVQRVLPKGGGESLLVVEQRARSGGDGSVDLRYVHQIREAR